MPVSCTLVAQTACKKLGFVNEWGVDWEALHLGSHNYVPLRLNEDILTHMLGPRRI